MTLYLTHGNGEESIPLELPASSSQVEEIDIRLDDICSGEGNFRISDVKSSVKGLWQFIRSADLLDPEDLEKLNRLSRQIDTMSEKEHQIFAGALLSECISNLNDVLQTVERIGQYGMIPKVTCDRELGGYLVEHGKIDCPEHLKPYLDYVGIGAEFYSNCGGAYTLDGYVVRKEHLPNHSQEPEPWRNENRDEMLRITLRAEGKPDYTLVLPADEEYLDAVKAYGDVMFVYENGLMLGTSKTLFSPHGTATRGMMATILWRMEGSPVPKGKNSFTDVEAGKWYADAITWTAENGIFAGYGKDKFGPDDPITREQLAAIFYRYADYKGYDLTVKGNLDKFKDADKITDYAKTAMQWAVGSGLVKGKSGNLLDPQGTATRAEIAAMLHRFIEKYELVQGKAPGGLMGWIDPKRLQIPKTGDSSVLGLWGISLCTSLAGCLALTTWQIRRRREEEALQIIEK